METTSQVQVLTVCICTMPGLFCKMLNNECHLGMAKIVITNDVTESGPYCKIIIALGSLLTIAMLTISICPRMLVVGCLSVDPALHRPIVLTDFHCVIHSLQMVKLQAISRLLASDFLSLFWFVFIFLWLFIEHDANLANILSQPAS